MAEYKPLGSEKLNSDEKLKRILELAYYNRENSKNNTSKAELVNESKSGGVYGIVKEKDGYYVKRGLNESSLDYIGGMFMKNKNRFSSYAEALRRLELLRGQEQLQEETKYVLKQKPKVEAPAPESTMDAASAMPAADVPAPEGDMLPPSDEMPAEPSAEMPTEPEMGPTKKSDYMAEVQKYAGKLGQELRDQNEKMESDDIKYVLNMIISAVDLDKLDLEDLEEIGKKFERNEEGELPSEEMPAEPEPEAEPEMEPEADSGSDYKPSEDLEETDEAMMKLEKFINDSEMYEMDEDYDDFSKYSISENDESDQKEDVVEIDMDEVKSQIAKSVSETLSKYFK
jgi:hypothetical protein